MIEGAHILKEVGASGQISLGEKHAGKLFDVIAYPDGRFELIPVRVVATMLPTMAVNEGSAGTADATGDSHRETASASVQR